jgi:outer membrane protein OmpA-like peptidoglycan-associated protein
MLTLKSLPSLLILALAATGCATKTYVQRQTAPIQQRIDEIDKKHAKAVERLDAKEQTDVSRLEERAASADIKAQEAARAAQAADAKAQQAREAARAAEEMAQANQAKLGDFATALGGIDNFKIFGSEQVPFRFGRATLSPDARNRLEQVAQKVSGLSRYAIEVQGFADKTGSREYNLVLSRRRADAVVRHLVASGVPLRRIHMIGLGSEQPGAERRVVVTIYAP